MDEHRYIFGTEAKEMDAMKEVKVRIPVAHMIKLHGIKLVRGQNISDSVANALERYFAETDPDA